MQINLSEFPSQPAILARLTKIMFYLLLNPNEDDIHANKDIAKFMSLNKSAVSRLTGPMREIGILEEKSIPGRRRETSWVFQRAAFIDWFKEEALWLKPKTREEVLVIIELLRARDDTHEFLSTFGENFMGKPDYPLGIKKAVHHLLENEQTKGNLELFCKTPRDALLAALTIIVYFKAINLVFDNRGSKKANSAIFLKYLDLAYRVLYAGQVANGSKLLLPEDFEFMTDVAVVGIRSHLNALRRRILNGKAEPTFFEEFSEADKGAKNE